MSLSILFNHGAAVAHRLIGQADRATSASITKLSAGSRVVSARDDAAALAIGSRLRSESAAMRQVSVNALQATSLVQIADGAAARVTDILVRMKTLAVQAGSGQLSTVERAMLNTEYQSALSEIDRIAMDTEFNGTGLIDNSGFVYTIRQLPENGILKLNGEALALGDTFTQADIDNGRVKYTHDGGGSSTDRLVVSVADSDGSVIGTISGETNSTNFEDAEYFASGGLADIFASKAYARGGTGSGVTVAVIDTGVDLYHTDLDGNIVGGVDIVDGVLEGGAATAGTTSGDGNDTNDGNSSDGHGTHVAGIIAAENDGTGIQGVAYEASILAIKATDPSTGLFNANDVADAIDYARLNGAKVINMSLGFGQDVATPNQITAAIVRAVNAGIVVVAAAGNSTLSNPDFPASFAIDSTAQGALIAVGAVDGDGTIASFSNHAGDVKNFVVVAPGVSITSDQYNGGTTPSSNTVAYSGTSMAAPHVAGAAAILTQLYGSGTDSDLTGAEIAKLILTTATDLGTSGIDTTYGRGMLNLDNATAAQMTLSINITSSSLVDNSGIFDVVTGQTATLTATDLSAANAYTSITSAPSRSFSFKVGTGNESQDGISVSTTSLTAIALNLTNSLITTVSNADAAGAAVTAALDRVNLARAGFGSSQNRLEFAADNIFQAVENMENARSYLLDLDVAQEMTTFTAKQVLSQAGLSMLAQANTQGRQLLQLFN